MSFSDKVIKDGSLGQLAPIRLIKNISSVFHFQPLTDYRAIVFITLSLVIRMGIMS